MNRRSLLKRFAEAVGALVGIKRVPEPVHGIEFWVKKNAAPPSLNMNAPVTFKNYTMTYTHVTKEEMVEKMRAAMKHAKFRRIESDPVLLVDEAARRHIEEILS